MLENTQYTFVKRQTWHPLGCLREIKRKGILDFLSYNNSLYDLVHFRLGFQSYVQVNHPDLIEYILIKNHKNFQKSDTHIRFREVLGDGILTSNGEKWKSDRKILQPAFDKKIIETSYAETIINHVQKEVSVWNELSKAKKPINITHSMSMITLRVILDTMLNLRASPELLCAIDDAIQSFISYTGLPRPLMKIDLQRYLCPSRYKELQRHKKFLIDLVYDCYSNEKQKDDPKANNMMSMLVASGKNFEEICDQVITMIFAGYETTATLIQWLWFCLDKFPEYQNELLTEMSSLLSNNIDCSRFDQMPILDAFINETMRLYPPFWATARSAIKSDYFGEHFIPKGTILLLPQYTLHRNSEYWKNPTVFDINRFDEDNLKRVRRGCYFPFSQGVRKCIGYRFATLEAKIVLSILLPLFQLRIASSVEEKIRPTISLKFKDDIWMNVIRR